MALGVVAFIYVASRIRVELLRQAGESTGSDFEVYLPAALYFAEILLGIPTFFFLVILFSSWRIRKHRRELSKARHLELVLRRSAVSKYSTYIARLSAYNDRAQRLDTVPSPLIEPCEELRRLLGSRNPVEPDTQAATAAPTGNGPVQQPGSNGADDGSGSGANGGGGNQRIQDLLNLLDQDADAQNRTL